MSEPYLGLIMITPYTFTPRDWAYCDNQMINISANSALYSLIGNVYGGDGRTTFALPDLRARAPIGASQTMGQAPDLSASTVGQKGGADEIFLSLDQMPAHSHAVSGALEDPKPQFPGEIPAGSLEVYMDADFTQTKGNFTQTSYTIGAFADYLEISTAQATTTIPTSNSSLARPYISTFGVQGDLTVNNASNFVTIKAMAQDPSGTKPQFSGSIQLTGTARLNQNTVTIPGYSFDFSVNPGVAVKDIPLQPVGLGQSFPNRDPSLALNYIISLSGLYPSHD